MSYLKGLVMNKLRIREKYGDWAFITGASSGIGRAFAENLVDEGVNCIIVSNDSTGLEETRLALKKRAPSVEIVAKCIDLTDDSKLDELLSLPEVKKSRILINSAGVGLIGYLIQFSLEQSLKIDRLNQGTVLRLSYFYAEKLYKSGERGAIINVSSANAEVGLAIPFSSVYSSGKTWVKFFTQSLHYEMKPFGVDVLNVSPGPTRTNFQSHAQTKILSWAESADSVAKKSLKSLGYKNSIVTNPIARILLLILKFLPTTNNFKFKLVAWFYGNVLARQGLVNLPKK